jgi:ABC-2 type transport system permease protein
MSPLGAIAAAKFRTAGHAIASIRNESKLKVAVVSVAAAILWLSALLLFHESFRWLRKYLFDPHGGGIDLTDILMARLLSVFALALFFMLIFSNVLIVYSTLYRSREVEYMVQSPLPFRSLFLARFAESVVFSSWASAFLGSPLILAYGIASKALPPFYLAAVAFYIPYVTIPAALGALVAMTLVRFLPRINRFGIFLLCALALAAVFAYLRQRIDVNRLTDQLLVTTLLDASARTQSPLLPSHWAARGVLAAAQGRYGDSLYDFLLLTSNALMLTWLACEFAQRLFMPGWSALAGSSGLRLRRPGRGILGRLDGALGFLREPTRSLVAKDIRLFWRDATQWSQFAIFFGLMAFYVANLRNRGLTGESQLWRTWVACLNLAACTLILATLTSRFVYPLISLEGRRFWIVGLAPLTFRQLVWQKFWLSVATCSFFTVGLVILSAYMLRLPPLPFSLSVYTICLTNLALSGLAVGLGSLYPNFQEDNPARVVSGMGGTLNFLLSMAYIVLVVGVLTAYLLWIALREDITPTAYWTGLGVVLTLVTVASVAALFIPMRLGLRHLRSTEF